MSELDVVAAATAMTENTENTETTETDTEATHIIAAFRLLRWLNSKISEPTTPLFVCGRKLSSFSICNVSEVFDCDEPLHAPRPRKALRMPSGARAVAKTLLLSEQCVFMLASNTVSYASMHLHPVLRHGAMRSDIRDLYATREEAQDSRDVRTMQCFMQPHKHKRPCTRAHPRADEDDAHDAHSNTEAEAVVVAEPERVHVRSLGWLLSTSVKDVCFLQLSQFWCETAVSCLVAEFVAPHCIHVLESKAQALLMHEAPIAPVVRMQTRMQCKRNRGKRGRKGNKGRKTRSQTQSKVSSASLVGTTIMERVHCTLDAIVRVLSTPEIRTIVFQILVALHVAQTRIGLKHHDLHTDNVFLLFLDPASQTHRLSLKLRRRLEAQLAEEQEEQEEDKQPQWDTDAFEYVLGGRRFRVPHHGIVAKLGDYDLASAHHPGMSACARVMRADLELLDVFEPNEEGINEWGSWNGELVGHHGYDAQFFVGYVLSQPWTHKLAPSAIRFLSNVLTKLGGRESITAIGRPQLGFVSNVTPLELLHDVELFGDFVIDMSACDKPLVCDDRDPNPKQVALTPA